MQSPIAIVDNDSAVDETKAAAVTATKSGRARYTNKTIDYSRDHKLPMTVLSVGILYTQARSIL